MTTHTRRTVGPTIYLKRETNHLTDDQVLKIARACHSQVYYHLAPVWVTLHRPVRVLRPGQRVPAGDQVIRLMDFSDASGTLGYHTEDGNDLVSGVVGVGTILDAGAQLLTGKYAVSSIVSHEVCEMVVNPNVSGWSDSGKGWLVATEVCDPVQSSFYEIDGVTVSNFVTPDFFSPVVAEGDRFDHMGVLTAPFEIAKGGYVLNYEAGDIRTYYGATPPPEWLMKLKDLDPARTRRLKDHRPS